MRHSDGQQRHASTPSAVATPAQAEPVAPAQAPAIVTAPPTRAVVPGPRSHATQTVGDISEQVALLDGARSAVSAGDGQRALEIVRRYQDRYPAGTFRPEATAIRVEALMQLGRTAEAQELAERFIARTGAPCWLDGWRMLPDSPHREASGPVQPDTHADRGGDRAGTVERGTAELIGVAQQGHPDANPRRDLDGRAGAGGKGDTRGHERPGCAVRLFGICPACIQSAHQRGRAGTGHEPLRANAQRTCVQRGGIERERSGAPRLGEIVRHTCVAPTNSAGDQMPSRSSAAIPLMAIPGMTAGAGPKIAWPATDTAKFRRV